MTDRISNLPILSLWGRVLVVLQGEITDDLAARLSEEVLQLLHRDGAEGMVIDITGVWMIDSHLCSVLSTLAAAARLMGTPTILSGMSADSAQALQAMGIALKSVKTALTVEEALARLGVEPQIATRETTLGKRRRLRFSKRARYEAAEERSVDEDEQDGTR